jgi:hypothetical protein
VTPASDCERRERGQDLARRDFLKVGAGFSLALSFAGALGGLGGCSDTETSPASGFDFLKAADVELFTALAPAVVDELAALDASHRKVRVASVVRNIDATCAALGLDSQKELRKLLDLLGIAPLRYALGGVGAWNDASIATLQAFLTRWRGSRFATLNAGGNILVKLTSSSYYVLPASWPAVGYPGPLAHVYQAINS